MSQKRVIFDASAINALAKDRDVIPLMKCFGLAHLLGITETVVAEIAADPDEDRRRLHLSLLKRLLSCGHCIQPFHWIVREHAKAFLIDPTNYRWTTLDVGFPACEEEVSRQEIIHCVSDATRCSNKEHNKAFLEIFREARPALQRIIADGIGSRPSLEDVSARFLDAGGAVLAIGAGIMERSTGVRPEKTDVTVFMERCPPFKALLGALCVIEFDLCIRAEGKPSLGNAGRLDMFSAVYLPYCDSFLTNDRGQFKSLNEVAHLVDLDVSVVMYEDFRNKLLGLRAT